MHVEAAFADAMAQAGLITQDPVIADGSLHRIHIEGQRRGTKNAAYVLHSDGKAAGWFQDFVTGTRATWKAASSWKPDPDARRRMEQAKVQRRSQEEARHQEAASRAARIWEQATECESHPYLDLKHVKPCGLRVKGNSLLIPLRDSWGNLWSLQRIEPHGDGFTKRFLTGGRVKGLMHWIGNGTQTVFVAEGYATAATLAEQTGMGGYVAFNAGNLEAASVELREIFPHRRIIVAGDADPVGRAKAEQAALSARAELSIPDFPPGVPGTDWNDLATWGAYGND
jgi:putative DNA primase/helicase